jgi:glyoxylase-like metal-dependent hydrolase (beta-lactamase superfamily II)
MQYQIIDLEFLGNERAISAFLIRTTEGPVLIESGPYSTFPALKAALAAHGFAPTDIKHVFLSHIHFDHAGAAWAFAETGATIYVHPRGAGHLAQPEKLYQSARMIYQDKMDSLWGAMQSIDEAQIHQPAHQEEVRIGNLTFTAIHTPGHAVHHIAWSVMADGSERKTIFAGDVAGVKIDSGPVVPPCPPPDINIEHWLESIQLLRLAQPDELVLTHFGPVPDIDFHLSALQAILLDWANWIKPYFEAQTPIDAIVPKFEAYVEAQLLAQGVDTAGRARYAAANPAFMSVAGLMRYWFKKSQA